MKNVINEDLSRGRFDGINDVYLRLLALQRHSGHSGPNGYPAKKDRCAKRKEVVDEEKQMQERWNGKN